MNPMHPELARHEISRRLSAAADERRRRLARGRLHWTRRMHVEAHDPAPGR